MTYPHTSATRTRDEERPQLAVTRRMTLLGSLLALTVLCGAPGLRAQTTTTEETKSAVPPTADEKAPPPTEERIVLTEFVVTGIRASAIKALEVKRASVNMVDAIVAEDIGKFPDNNVIEAMQRLPGVQVTDRASGQIATVTIRGLTDVSTTINGRNVFTASGQALSLQDIPASLLGSVDVYKTRTADLIETGIAGQIDIHTHRPFDFSGDKVSVAARYIYADLADEYGPHLSALYSKRWETDAGKFGALLNVAYSETPYRNNSVTPGAMVPFMTAAAPAGWVPYQRIFTNGAEPWQPGLTDGLSSAAGATMKIDGQDVPYVLGRDAIFASDATGKTKRPAVNLSLQFAPSKTAEYTFEAFYDGYRNENFNNLLFSFVDWWGGPHGAVTLYPGTNIIKTRESTPFVYAFNSGDLTTGETDSYVYAFGGKWDLSPDFKLKADLAYQTSEFNSTFFAMRTDRVAAEGIKVDFNADDGLPAFSFPGQNLNDPAIWNIAQLYDQAHRNQGEAVTATVDGTYHTGWNFLTKLNFGARYDDREASEAQRIQEAANLGQSLSLYPNLQHYNSGFFDGKAAIPSSWVVADGYYIRDHADEVRNLYKSTVSPSLQTGNDLKLVENFNVNEITSAAYFMGTFETEVAGRKLDGQAGVRFVSVETDMAFGGKTGSASTDKLLPSASVRYNLTNDLRLRLAYGETLRRPNFGDLNPTITYTKDVTNIGYGTASGGNANLRPTESKNYDVALEYFVDDATAVFLTGFRREIDGLVVGFRKRVTYENYDYVLSQPDNASNGTLSGYEIGGSYFPKNLPGLLNGLGLQASYTSLRSDQDIPITDATGKVTGTQRTPFFAVSDSSYTGVLAYEREKFSARLSYQWRASFLHHYEAALFAGPIGVYNKPERSMDVQFSYRLTKDFVLTLDATNLTNEIYQSYYGNEPGNSTTNNFSNSLYSRTIALGARYSF